LRPQLLLEALSGASPLLSHCLEERVAEHAVRLSRSAKILNTRIKGFGIGDAGLNREFANALVAERIDRCGQFS
jgi:hypothetical protein